MDDLFQIIGVIVGIILAVVFFIFLMSVVTMPLFIKTCDVQWNSFEHRYGWWEGCMIKTSGKWIPTDNYREIK